MPKLLTILLTFTLFLSGCILVGQKVSQSELQPEQVATSTSDEIDTSDWKTYRNEEYGFEFRYPEGWLECETPQGDYGFLFLNRSEINCKNYQSNLIVKVSKLESDFDRWLQREEERQGGYHERINFSNGGVYVYQKGLVDGNSSVYFVKEELLVQILFYSTIQDCSNCLELIDSFNFTSY